MSIGDVVAAIAMVIVAWGYGKMVWLLTKRSGFYEATSVCNELKRLHAQGPSQPKLPDYCRDPENCNGSCQREIACNH